MLTYQSLNSCVRHKDNLSSFMHLRVLLIGKTWTKLSLLTTAQLNSIVQSVEATTHWKAVVGGVRVIIDGLRAF